MGYGNVHSASSANSISRRFSPPNPDSAWNCLRIFAISVSDKPEAWSLSNPLKGVICVVYIRSIRD